MTYSWKEGAIRRKELQIGQQDARSVTGANKTPKTRKKDKPWAVEVTFQWATTTKLKPTFVRHFLHEEDARKFASKQIGKFTTTRVFGPGETP